MIQCYALRHNEALCEHLVDGCISLQGEEDAGMKDWLRSLDVCGFLLTCYTTSLTVIRHIE